MTIGSTSASKEPVEDEPSELPESLESELLESPELLPFFPEPPPPPDVLGGVSILPSVVMACEVRSVVAFTWSARAWAAVFCVFCNKVASWLAPVIDEGSMPFCAKAACIKADTRLVLGCAGVVCTVLLTRLGNIPLSWLGA